MQISNAHNTWEVVQKVFLCLLEQRLNLQTAKQFASLAAAVKQVELNPNITVGSSLLDEIESVEKFAIARVCLDDVGGGTISEMLTKC